MFRYHGFDFSEAYRLSMADAVPSAELRKKELEARIERDQKALRELNAEIEKDKKKREREAKEKNLLPVGTEVWIKGTVVGVDPKDETWTYEVRIDPLCKRWVRNLQLIAPLIIPDP